MFYEVDVLVGNNFLVSRILARFENKNSFRKQQKTKNVVSDVVRRWVKVTGAKQLRTCSLAANCISWIKVSFCWGWMHDVYGWQVFTINIKQKSKYELLFKILLDIWVSIDTLTSYEQYVVNYTRVGTIRNKVYVIKYFGFHYTCSCQEQTIHTREQLQFKC